MKTTRLLKAEIIILAFAVILWAVDLKTDCVPRAAAGALRQVVKVAPNSRYAHELLSIMCDSCGQDDESFEAYLRADELKEINTAKKAVRSDPDDPNAHFDLGRAYYDANDFTEAIECYREAIRLDPEFRQGHMDLGDVYASSKQYEASIQAYKEAVALDPNDSWVHVCLAFTYDEMGRYEEAISEWQHVIELEPEIAGLRALLADVYLETGQYEEAVAACEEGLRIDPKHPKLHYTLGRVYLEMGNKDLASEEYRVLKELDEELAKELLGLIEQEQEVRDGSH